jgi:glycosyltransferase involved in cell wall biosynthesis
MNFIYFLCPDDPRPVGGIKVLYRHVDILNRNGYDAAIIHKKKGFRCEWFENHTRVDYYGQIKPDPFDFVVTPEMYGPRLMEHFPGVKKVIHNQNAYYTFIHYNMDPRDKVTAYTNEDLAAVIVVSDDSAKYLAHVFPKVKVTRVHNSIDGTRFSFRELSQKKKRISFLTNKHADELLQVINILKHRGVLNDVEVVPIAGKTEMEVAEILADTLLFLSFGYPEGCPAPPQEAMLSGALVVGYHGFGGREYFLKDFSWPIEVGDIIGFARTAEEVLNGVLRESQRYQKIALAARDFISREYSIERERKDILSFWDDLMLEHGRDAIATDI